MFRLRITFKKNVDTSTMFILPDSQRNHSGPAQTLHRAPYDSCRTFVLAARWRRTTCFNPRLWNHRWEMVSHMYCLKPTKSEENTKFSIFSFYLDVTAPLSTEGWLGVWFFPLIVEHFQALKISCVQDIPAWNHETLLRTATKTILQNCTCSMPVTCFHLKIRITV